MKELQVLFFISSLVGEHDRYLVHYWVIASTLRTNEDALHDYIISGFELVEFKRVMLVDGAGQDIKELFLQLCFTAPRRQEHSSR